MLAVQSIFSKRLPSEDKLNMVGALRDLADTIEQPLLLN